MESDENTLVMSSDVYEKIMNTIGTRKPECGGVLGVDQNKIVSAYYFDRNGDSQTGSYAPDVNSINQLLAKNWMPNGLLMIGIVHSHSNGKAVPSCGDIQYGIRILRALDTVHYFYLPIVAFADHTPVMRCFVLLSDPKHLYVCKEISFVII